MGDSLEWIDWGNAAEWTQAIGGVGLLLLTYLLLRSEVRSRRAAREAADSSRRVDDMDFEIANSPDGPMFQLKSSHDLRAYRSLWAVFDATECVRLSGSSPDYLTKFREAPQGTSWRVNLNEWVYRVGPNNLHEVRTLCFAQDGDDVLWRVLSNGKARRVRVRRAWPGRSVDWEKSVRKEARSLGLKI